MTDEVLPRLQQKFALAPIEHVVVMTAGLGESFLAEKIKDWESALPPNVKLAYLPSLGSVRLRLTGHPAGQPDLRPRMLALPPALRERIGEHIFSEEDTPLEVVVGQLLQQRHWQLGTAESCTGGAVAARLTSVPGSSAYFRGSVVAYANEVKEQVLGVAASTLAEHGAVSEATVREMAEGARARLGCDVAVATSGIAGPGGGTPTKPVGTICIACATPTGTVTRQLGVDRGRATNIDYTVQAALILLWQQLAEHPAA